MYIFSIFFYIRCCAVDGLYNIKTCPWEETLDNGTETLTRLSLCLCEQPKNIAVLLSDIETG